MHEWARMRRRLLCLAALAGAAIVGNASAQPGPDGGAPGARPILGRPVVDTNGGAAGRVVDVLVDASGQVQAVVLNLGGFMGLGQRRVAVTWQMLRVTPEAVTVLLPADAIAAFPEYGAGNAPVLAAPPRP